MTTQEQTPPIAKREAVVGAPARGERRRCAAHVSLRRSGINLRRGTTTHSSRASRSHPHWRSAAPSSRSRKLDDCDSPRWQHDRATHVVVPNKIAP